jgi:hypothetical protein
MVERHDDSLLLGCKTTARKGRKSARVRPLQEKLLQKRRFWRNLVIAMSREIPASADMQPASQAGCLFVGFDKLRDWVGHCGRFFPRNVKSWGDSGD